MALRFFTDHCVPHSVGEALAAAGHTVFRLRDHLPTDAPDPDVIAKAQELNAILVSLNGDFADIVTYPPGNFGGIVSLQLRNHPETIPQVVEKMLQYTATEPEASHYAGTLLIVEIIGSEFAQAPPRTRPALHPDHAARRTSPLSCPHFAAF